MMYHQKTKYLIEVSMRKDGELFPDGLQEPESNVKTIVRTMCQLLWESHGPERTSSPAALIKCTSRVPSTITWHHIIMIQKQDCNKINSISIGYSLLKESQTFAYKLLGLQE